MTEHAAAQRLIRPLRPRDPTEHHRVATPLELLFDLVSVIAIASAAVGLHHAIAEGHAASGVLSFLMAFFAVWWAWMNYTWFSSAYDNDDVVYRLLTMVIMAGSLAISAGIPQLFTEAPDFTMVIAGYVVMRIGMVCLWLRAALHDPQRRKTGLAYAAGILIAQIYWVGFLAAQPLDGAAGYGLWLLGVLLELAVPAVAERVGTNTPWHRHHIVERYSLLNIIVLGETLLAGTNALRETTGHFSLALVEAALAALVIVFSLWWAYFARQEHLQRAGLGHALFWGYAHFAIFAAGAATGAGFGVVVDILTHHADVSPLTGDYAVAIPVAVYFTALWLVRDRFLIDGLARYALLACGFLSLLAPALHLGLTSIAVLTAFGVVLRNWLAKGGPSGHLTGSATNR